MQYIFKKENDNYEDFASGRVIYNKIGSTAFPVRLASEIFLRSKSYLEEKGNNSPYTIFDPCCGGAYLLTVISLLHGNDIQSIISSDIDPNMIELAKRNLSLLTQEGIQERVQELKEYIALYDKKSHKEALKSAVTLSIIRKNKIIPS